MDTRVQEGGGEPTRDDAVRRCIYNILQCPGRALGKAKSRGSIGAWRWRSTGSSLSHVSVLYHDGPLDITESVYFHNTCPLRERWHWRRAKFRCLILGSGFLGAVSPVMCTIPYFYRVHKSLL